MQLRNRQNRFRTKAKKYKNLDRCNICPALCVQLRIETNVPNGALVMNYLYQ